MGQYDGSPHSRNLSDQQLIAIRETGGIVGVNFATSFLRPDGRRDADTPIELVIEHIEHVPKHVGETVSAWVPISTAQRSQHE